MKDNRGALQWAALLWPRIRTVLHCHRLEMKVGFTCRVNITLYIVFIWYEVVYFRTINISLQVKKFNISCYVL